MCTSMISLSKIEHQWRGVHLFSQRNKTAELAVRMGVGTNSEGGWTKFEKRGLENIGGVGLHKIGGSRFSLCQP